MLETSHLLDYVELLPPLHEIDASIRKKIGISHMNKGQILENQPAESQKKRTFSQLARMEKSRNDRVVRRWETHI